jgi:hypothetical protein
VRIVVDAYPESPRDCLFSRLSHTIKGNEKYYVCTLKEYIPEADRNNCGFKPGCICKGVTNCKYLIHESY